MSEIERLNMIAEWQEQHKQLIEDLDNSKKRIEELEKDKAYTEGQLDEQIQATLKLQKENAELKARLNAINLLTPELEKVSKLRRQQLTKAKELLKRCYDNYIYLQPLRNDIEQFLKNNA